MRWAYARSAFNVKPSRRILTKFMLEPIRRVSDCHRVRRIHGAGQDMPVRLDERTLAEPFHGGPLVALPAPDFAVLDDSVIGAERTVRMRATSPRGATILYVDLQAPGDITGAKLDGRPLDRINLPGDQRTRLRLAYHAIPTEGIQIELTPSASGPLRVQLEDRSNGLPNVPGIASVPRPADEMMAPFEMADPTVVTRSLVLSH
jgi:hypothetical protein